MASRQPHSTARATSAVANHTPRIILRFLTLLAQELANQVVSSLTIPPSCAQEKQSLTEEVLFFLLGISLEKNPNVHQIDMLEYTHLASRRPAKDAHLNANDTAERRKHMRARDQTTRNPTIWLDISLSEGQYRSLPVPHKRMVGLRCTGVKEAKDRIAKEPKKAMRTVIE